MLNIVNINNEFSSSDQSKISLLFDQLTPNLKLLKSGDIDNILFKKTLTPGNLPPTPTHIKSTELNIPPEKLITKIANFLGNSEEKIENSVRFKTIDSDEVNVETWHSHPQFSYSIFYCLRGDLNAKTYFLSANQIIENATASDKKMLLESNLIQKTGDNYRFSKEIYNPSDFQNQIEGLDLPDTTKALNSDKENKAYKYLLQKMIDTEDFIIYEPGDLTIYNERETMRFSPSYRQSTKPGEERWLIGISVN